MELSIALDRFSFLFVEAFCGSHFTAPSNVMLAVYNSRGWWWRWCYS